jgi:hypothetical protein
MNKQDSNKNYRITIAKAVAKFAKEQKIGIDRAIQRAQATDRFDNVINKYMKAKKIGKNEAWRRVITAMPEV